MGKVRDAIDLLRARSATMSGDELESLMLGLGFNVKAGSSGKHYVVTHDGLDGFLSSSFDKGHKKQMLVAYPNRMRKLIIEYRSQLEEILGENDVET